MTLDEFIALASSDARWDGVIDLPWGDHAFSARMLREHLSQLHDGASRRIELIDRHVAWLHEVILQRQPQRVLDLACGPGLYTERLAALGHACTGVDIAPAAIAYARERVSAPEGNPRYVLADMTTVPVDSSYDLVMVVHGQFNVLVRQAAAQLLRSVWEILAPGGHLLLEVHPSAAVEAIGRRPRTWHALSEGLFSDTPYLRIDEARWDDQERQSTSLYWIITGDGRVERYGTVTQAYGTNDYEHLFAEAGFAPPRSYPSLAGSAEHAHYAVLVAELDGRPQPLIHPPAPPS